MSHNDYDLKKFHKMIELAIHAVSTVNDPWKIPSFSIFLSKLVNSENFLKDQNDAKDNIKNSNPNIEQKINEFAEKCGITKLELDTVLSINNNSVEIIYPIQGKESEKHLLGAQLMLIASESILGLDWIPSSILIECLRGMGVTDLSNVSLNLKKHTDLIRSQGTRGNKKYKLTSGIGRQSAYELIKKLAKGDKLNES